MTTLTAIMNKENDGLIILNPSHQNKPDKTVVVLGVPRGGTSMIAGTLSKLGVFMGEADHLAPLYENMTFDKVLKEGNKKELQHVIHTYDQAYSIWGFKRLSQLFRFELCQRKLFREPVYIIVFRDVLAITKRRMISLDKSFTRELFKALYINFKLLVLVLFTKRPTLLVSYEKTLLSPESFVTEVSDFLDLHHPERMKEAIEFIKPSPPSYTMRSTTFSQLDKTGLYYGYLDSVDKQQISGWALCLSNQNPLSIELKVNGELQQTAKADLNRDDVADNDARFQAACGFAFTLEELKAGDKIEVCIADKGLHLINSPLFFDSASNSIS